MSSTTIFHSRIHGHFRQMNQSTLSEDIAQFVEGVFGHIKSNDDQKKIVDTEIIEWVKDKSDEEFLIDVIEWIKKRSDGNE